MKHRKMSKSTEVNRENVPLPENLPDIWRCKGFCRTVMIWVKALTREWTYSVECLYEQRNQLKTLSCWSGWYTLVNHAETQESPDWNQESMLLTSNRAGSWTCRGFNCFYSGIKEASKYCYSGKGNFYLRKKSIYQGFWGMLSAHSFARLNLFLIFPVFIHCVFFDKTQDKRFYICFCGLQETCILFPAIAKHVKIYTKGMDVGLHVYIRVSYFYTQLQSFYCKEYTEKEV